MKKIYFFDLDGTVTDEEILPKIAQRFNFKKKMTKLTRAAMAGDIPFEDSFRSRHKMLSKFNINDTYVFLENSTIHLSALLVNYLLKDFHEIRLKSFLKLCWY